MATARRIAAESPLLLVIDEFGKNLEAIRDGSDADPYLLQQLAEAGQGAGLPIFMVTLQHLSFDDCLSGLDSVQRREWSKVQGRFEDVSFVESAAQARALIGTVFDVTDSALRARIDRWAKPLASEMAALGVAELADPAVVASCYPLHPLTALVLPELCNRHGQHERTLFSFLAGAHPSGVVAFLDSTKLASRGPLPSLGLEAVYDFFVGSGSLSIASPRQSSRWSEIATRLRDAHGLSAAQARTAKSVALLNLVSTSGTVRASRRLLGLAGHRVDAALADLQRAGIVTYRDFADEYRVWHGSDVDMGVRLDAARQRMSQRPLVEILAEIEQPTPLVAARHSATFDTLRVFQRRYAAAGEEVAPLAAPSAYDGTVLLVAASEAELPALASVGDHTTESAGPGAKPVVAAIPRDVAALDEAGREVAALASLLDDPVVAGDRVAQRELSERLSQARGVLDQALCETFGSQECRWVLLNGPKSGEYVELSPGRGSSPVSVAADLVYSHSPPVGNEMLNRSELTSQGAKARRLLLEAMIERGDSGLDDLGFEGHGPETAMYRSFLLRTGLHRRGEKPFGPPSDAGLQPAWRILADEFGRSTGERINLAHVGDCLQSPPVGMKAAVVPVFITAGLLAFRDEVAIYEHGTFTPVLSPEVSERMVRNPAHFDVKHFANTSGGRLTVVEALAERLGITARTGGRSQRVSNVLAVVSSLVTRISRLDNHTRRTRRLSAGARAVRNALTTAVEPDQLLFESLPEALGFAAVGADAPDCEPATAFASAAGGALDELESCLERMLEDLLARLLDACGVRSRAAVSGQAATLDGEVLDPEVRAFVLALANDSAEDDLAWISAVATVVARKAPAEWTDEDRGRFDRELPERLAAFHRLVALHFDRRADGGGPFDPLRVTITRPDGTEYIRMVGVDARRRAALEAALDDALAATASITGSDLQAEQSLLALLSERLLPSGEPAAAISSATGVAAVLGKAADG